ncbi:MAG: (2Fe-2S)-binding protein [Alphaproteobacteria bacterium]|nr:(2Fe-2S)-binding protein [Alphaproteobacteria bacterium]
MIRLIRDRSTDIKRTRLLTFHFDGQPVQAHEGETVAVALLRAGQLTTRTAPNDQAPRGLFCCMGLCQECVVVIDGRVTEACRRIVTDGLVVEPTNGAP